MDEKEILKKIIDWSNTQEALRAVILTSSRTNPDIPKDPLSDYDIVLYVTDVNQFTNNNTWVNFIGNVLVKFNDKWEEDGRINHTRLVIYENGAKIDFTITDLEVLKEIAQRATLPDSLEVGYQVLVDKDNLTANLKKPAFKAHIPIKPTEKEYLDLVEEFFWETSYVAKNLHRDELFPMKYSLDSVIKQEILRKMLEWQIECGHDWSLKPGDRGRHLKEYLPKEMWEQVEGTFVGPSVEDNWTALYKTIELFRKSAQLVADSLNYSYPDQLDQKMIIYLNNIRNLKG